MSETIACPGCGAQNPAGSAACAQCNFPLVKPSAAAAGAAVEPVAFDPGPRPVPPRRPRPEAMQPIQAQLWPLPAIAAALGLAFFAARGFWKSNLAPVEGARPEQQQQADLARAALAKDSTNLAARIALANILYD